MHREQFRDVVGKWLDIELTDRQLEQFWRYLDLLNTWNQRMNLVGYRTLRQIVVRGFLDSLSLLQAFQKLESLKVVDVGTGAGLPGIPLKLICPRLQLTLLDASQRIANFLRQVIQELELADVALVVARAEQAGRQPEYREQFDLALARGVASLAELVEYLLPLVRLSGRAVAYKGAKAHEEVQHASRAVDVLGGRVEAVVPVQVPGLEAQRALVVIRKVRPTPTRYPRKPGIPRKRPL